MARDEASEKSDRAFRTISEAAEVIGVPQHVLRFWETRFPQLQPLKRGGNRRYYRPADMALLETIRAMLHDRGLTIRGARLALADGDGGAPAVPARPRALRAIAADDAVPHEAFVATEIALPVKVARAAIDLAPLRAIRDRLARALAA